MLSNKSLKAVIGVGGVLIVGLLVGIIFLFVQNMRYTVYEQDTVIEGDLIVKEGEPIKLKNNAKLTVMGNAIIEDEILCDGGGVHLEVEGAMLAKNEFNCSSDPEEVGTENAGINLVLKGNAVFTNTSKITSTGSVQLVDDASKLALTQDQINERHENLDALTGVGIGPLEDEGEDLTVLPSQETLASSIRHLLVDTAHAQALQPDFGIPTNTISEQELIDALIDEMRQYIALDNPSNEEIRKYVEEWAGLLSLNEDVDGIWSDLSALMNVDLYRILLEAPNPEELTRWFFERALRKGETVVIIEGEIVIGDGERPPFDIDLNDDFRREGKKQEKPKRVVLNYDFSDDKGLALQNITITGLDGIHYGGVTAPDCNYTGNNGGDAMRFTGRAGRMRIGNLTLNNGNGGTGETVVSPRGCDESTMTGGNGGKPGNIKLVASQEFVIDGTVIIVPGAGGQGGGARATIVQEEQDACPAQNGKPVQATGGDGGDSKQRLRTSGTVVGIGNVEIEPAFAGNGGPAIADAFDTRGSDGATCGCEGGNGSLATANGGNGGDASRTDGSTGGDGGTATAYGGAAGWGGHCEDNEGPGGDGGNGGNAIATPGKAGTGNIAGNDGKVVEEIGGGAGFGGDGCKEGKAGSRGTGQTPGQEGEDGENTCTGEPEEPKTFISVIGFNGLYLPVFQLRVAGPDACLEDHWHGGPVKAITGEIVNDPAPDACGFGTTSQAIPMDKEVNRTEMIELFGDSITEHLSTSGQSEAVADESEGGMVQLCRVGRQWVPCPNQ